MARKKSDELGRSIIKARFVRPVFADGHKPQHHTTELRDGTGWTRLQSVTDQNDLSELLAVAQMAGTEFTAERYKSTILPGAYQGPVVPNQPTAKTEAEIEASKNWLRVPRRPTWDASTTADQLHQSEQEAFLEWRRQLASLESNESFILTPFERNLEVWRQLWRVLEHSQLIVQIVDARNPLLYHCEDLVAYINELDEAKKSLLLINKADLLTSDQRAQWTQYFTSRGLDFAFYSASASQEEAEAAEDADTVVKFVDIGVNSAEVCTKDQLLRIFEVECPGTFVGLVGYPNVGKSSTINSLIGEKKVAVAATPGKTKHFQTIILDNGITLCDCPGLVFPNMTTTKAELVLSGILPIDQLRESVSPTALLVQRIPRNLLEKVYGIVLPTPSEDEDPQRVPTASELLSGYAAARGFKTSTHGNPDESRAARFILKDYVNGKLLYCHPPPTGDALAFNRASFARILEEHKDKGRHIINPHLQHVKIDAALSGNVGHRVKTAGKNAVSEFSRAQLYPSLGGPTGKKHFKMAKRQG